MIVAAAVSVLGVSLSALVVLFSPPQAAKDNANAPASKRDTIFFIAAYSS